MSDVLRERIAGAIRPHLVAENYRADNIADDVIAALGLMEGIVSFDGERQRCWTTPWERIEEDV